MKLLLMILIILATSSCVSTRDRIDEKGVRVGEQLALVAEAIIFECKPRDTLKETWFSSASKKRCLKSSEHSYDSDIELGRVQEGTLVDIESIRFLNHFDTAFHVLYVRPDNAESVFLVYELHITGLLRHSESEL